MRYSQVRKDERPSFTAISLPQAGIQGTRLVDLPSGAFDLPMATYPEATFLTARAAARRMTAQGSGVILTITASPSRTAVPLMVGMSPAWAAIEFRDRMASLTLRKRLPGVAEIADVAAFVASDRAAP